MFSPSNPNCRSCICIRKNLEMTVCADADDGGPSLPCTHYQRKTTQDSPHFYLNIQNHFIAGLAMDVDNNKEQLF